MHIGIVTSYSARYPAGLERTLIIYLKALDGVARHKVSVYTHKESGLHQVFAQEGIKNIDIIEVGFGKWWKHIGLYFVKKADVYVFNGPVVPLLFSPKKYVVLLYDYAYKHYKGSGLRAKKVEFILDFFTKLGLRRAQRVITLSEATKNETVSFFHKEPGAIVPVYPGYYDICDVTEDVPADLPDHYFLFIGTLKERKNVLRVVQSYITLKQTYPQIKEKLLIVGKKSGSPYVQRIEEEIADHRMSDTILFSGHITDEQVCSVYRRATALVFPSLLEGFGFPVLEAMSTDTPVITSSISSLPEVAGDAALLVDPHDVKEIAQAMYELASSDERRAHLIQKGRERLLIFSAKSVGESFFNACELPQ